MLEHDETSERAGLRRAADAEDRWYPLRCVRGGVRLDRNGVSAFRRRRRWWSFTWDRILGVEWHHDSARLLTTEGAVRLDARYRDWPDLVRDIEARAGRQPADRAFEVSRETICAWLGIPPAGCLVLRAEVHGPHWQQPDLALALAMAAWAVPAAWRDNPWDWLILLIALCLAWLAGALVRPSVKADGDGLALRVRGRWHRFAWADIVAVRRDGPTASVVTHRGTYTVRHDTRAQGLRLAGTLEKVVAARNQGLRLPDAAPLPEGALSRPGEAEADERGLSRAEGDRTDRSEPDGSVGSVG